MKRKYNLFILTLIACIACEEEVPPPDFADEDKLVVNSIISPFSDEIIVEVSISRSAFGVINSGFDSDIVNNAIVTLSDGTGQVLIPFDQQRGFYSLPSSLFPLNEGEIYRLDVSANDVVVYAETQLPKKVSSLNGVTVSQNNVINVSWLDFPEQGNYYRLLANGNNDQSQYSEPYFFESNEFTSDTNRNGELLTARGEGNEFTSGYDNITIKIISSGALYSDYFRVLKNYVEGDPFSDPVQLPSNVVGGIGIFEAVQVSEFIIEEL